MQTVREVIKKLQTFDPSLPVMIQGYEFGIQHELSLIEQFVIQEYATGKANYGGDFDDSQDNEQGEFGKSFKAIVINRSGEL